MDSRITSPKGSQRWPRRIAFEAIVQASKLVEVGNFESETDLHADLELLARAYRSSSVNDILASAFEDRTKNLTGYYGSVADYYTGTGAQLGGVHSPDGAIHFGLDWDGTFRHDGFYGQARLVEEAVRRHDAGDVLELGPGKGLNSVYLAERNPGVKFTGVDLTPAHVAIATERGRHCPNLRILEGDFHNLTQIPNDSVDLAFEVEAGCYSDTPERVGRFLAEIGRVLRPGGRFMAFGYVRANDFDRCSRDAKLALSLVARAWVVDGFVPERSWNASAEQAGLRLLERRDIRRPNMPSVLRLYRQAKLFYVVMASKARAIPSMLMRRSTHNAVSALMLPYTFWLGALESRQALLQKVR
jgi:SAM-dependent methyltransferase